MLTQRSSIWITAAVTYSDRLLAFVVPLFVLKGLHDAAAYTAVEYVISVSVMIATFGDLGIRNYILYQYRESGDKRRTTELTLAGYGCALLLQLAAIALAAALLNTGDSGSPVSGLLLVAALLRASALGAAAVAYQLAVLHDRPALAALPSLVQWVLALIALSLWPAHATFERSIALVVPCLPLVLIGLAFSVRALARAGAAQGVRQLLTATRWGWPLLASAALSMGISNVSRIYGFSHLPQTDLVALNFWLRALSIVQLTHATAMTALALEIYDQRQPGLLIANLQRYLRTLCLAFLFVLILFAISMEWRQLAFPISPIAFSTLAAYTLTWCLGAYFETYVTRDGKPGTVLKVAMASAVVYVALLLGLRPTSAASLGMIMAVSAAVNLILLARATGLDLRSTVRNSNSV